MGFEFEWRNNRIVLLLLMCFPPLLYYLLIFNYSVNVPYQDDYAMLGFVEEFSKDGSLLSKIHLIIEPFGEHRLAITRIFILIIIKIVGYLDFRWLNMLGNLALLPSLVLIGKMIGLKNDMRKWALLFLIVLQPHFFKLMYYPMAAVQAFWGILFSMLYLFFVLNKKYWWISLLFYTLAVLTSGSGMFIPVVGIVLLMIRSEYRKATTHALFALATIWSYNPASNNIDYLASHGNRVLDYYLYLLGSSSVYPHFGVPLLSIGVGVAFFAYALFFVLETFCRKTGEVRDETLLMLGCMLYLLLITGLIAVGRVSDGDLFISSLDGRYRIYSLIFLALCCLHLWDHVSQLKPKFLNTPLIILLLALCGNLYVYATIVPVLTLQSEESENEMKSWMKTGDIGALSIGAIPPNEADTDLIEAVNSGIFRPSFHWSTNSR